MPSELAECCDQHFRLWAILRRTEYITHEFESLALGHWVTAAVLLHCDSSDCPGFQACLLSLAIIGTSSTSTDLQHFKIRKSKPSPAPHKNRYWFTIGNDYRCWPVGQGVYCPFPFLVDSEFCSSAELGRPGRLFQAPYSSSAPGILAPQPLKCVIS